MEEYVTICRSVSLYGMTLFHRSLNDVKNSTLGIDLAGLHRIHDGHVCEIYDFSEIENPGTNPGYTWFSFVDPTEEKKHTDKKMHFKLLDRKLKRTTFMFLTDEP